MNKKIYNILFESLSFKERSNINNNFWKWFGNSKIVDPQGNPLIVYHGTQAPEDFSEFAVGNFIGDADDYVRIGSGADPTAYLGSHFAYESHIASKFASGLYGERQNKKDRGRIIPVYLRVTNPYKTTESDMLKEMLKGSYNSSSVDIELDDYVYSKYIDDSEKDVYERYDTDEGFRMEVNYLALNSETNYDEYATYELAREIAASFQNKLIDAGHDGIIYNNEGEGGISIIIFQPEQAKSIYNKGTWKLNNPDIMK